MLLRTRLTLYLSFAFLLVVASLVLVGLRRESLLESRLAALAIVGQEAVWDGLIAETVAEITDEGHRLIGEMERRTPPSNAEQLRNWFDTVQRSSSGMTTIIQVTDTNGRLIYSSLGTIEQEPFLDAGSLDSVVETLRPVSGLQQTSPAGFMVLTALPLQSFGKPIGVLTLGRDVIESLHRFGYEIQASAFLLSLRGRLVEATSISQWEAVEPTVPPRDSSFSTAYGKGRSYTVTGIPVRNAEGQVVGTLVSLRDSTEELDEIDQLGALILGAVGLFLILILTALYVYLRHAFRPLEGAISVLKALSSGNTDVTLEATGSGEIGRIADTVAVFRANAMTLEQQRRHAERNRRRQERLIRQQLSRLAATLEGGGKDDALDDMRSLLEEPSSGTRRSSASLEASEDEQLGLLTQVMRGMSSRITDQHRRLTQMVAELQEAIVTKTKLAGLQQELEIARRLQGSILPKSLPLRDGVEIAGFMEPALEVGGDFYDFFLVDEDRLGLVIADVSGKGIPAALFMAISRSLVKAGAQSLKEPGLAINRVNDVMADENDEMMFVTLFYGVLDLRSGRLDFVNAGHNQPYLRHSDGGVEPLGQIGDIPLAVMEGFEFAEDHIQLSSGDLLLLYTDGVTEAFNTADEAYGEARLEQALGGLAADADAEDVIKTVKQSVSLFIAEAPPSDDLTMLALKWTPPTAEQTEPRT
ncbi:MAG: SpoIIE family protein phosphatase [Kiloniellales bacterium]